MTYGRQFTETQGSEECFGRCLWALGYTLASSVMPGGVKDACTSAVSRALPLISSLKFLRGQAYALIGLGFIDGTECDSLILKLADTIAVCFEQCAGDKDWCWFEDSLTYDNAVLPWAMFVASHKTGQERFLYIARESITFLDQDAFRDGFFRPVGCRGWWIRGAEPALYDQQPLEASMSALAHLVAYKVTGDEAMLKLARRSFAWYSGENSCRESLINAETGGCYDGIMADGLNRNQGAENIVGYCIASLALDNASSVPDILIVEADEHTTVYRPWGFYKVLDSGPGYKMKKIVVNPGEILSLQMHYHRSEHWIVIGGTAKVTIGNTEQMAHENESVFVPQTTKHRLENPGKLPLQIIEVQNGSYLGEDDIVRFDDRYGRV